MKKFELHLDALITLIAVFLLAFGFILYQRYQYSDLLQENVDLLWEKSNLEAENAVKTSLINKCQNAGKPDAQEKPTIKN